MLNNEKLKLITDIKERISSFFDTDDNRLDPDFIWEQALLLRPIFIKRKIDRKEAAIEEFLSRITLTVKSYDKDKDINFPTHKRAAIPRLIKHRENIKYLGPQDISLNKEYTRVSYDGFMNLSGREWTSDEVYYLVFEDKIFFSKEPKDADGVAYSTLAAWVLLQDITADSNFSAVTNKIVPGEYQTLLEDMVADMILKYAKEGYFNVASDATDADAIKGGTTSPTGLLNQPQQ